MRNTKRIPVILEMLEEVWLKQPDTRFGQLVNNLMNSRFTNRDMFYVEDSEFQEALVGLLEEDNNDNYK